MACKELGRRPVAGGRGDRGPMLAMMDPQPMVLVLDPACHPKSPGRAWAWEAVPCSVCLLLERAGKSLCRSPLGFASPSKLSSVQPLRGRGTTTSVCPLHPKTLPTPELKANRERPAERLLSPVPAFQNLQPRRLRGAHRQRGRLREQHQQHVEQHREF